MGVLSGGREGHCALKRCPQPAEDHDEAESKLMLGKRTIILSLMHVDLL